MFMFIQFLLWKRDCTKRKHILHSKISSLVILFIRITSYAKSNAKCSKKNISGCGFGLWLYICVFVNIFVFCAGGAENVTQQLTLWFAIAFAYCVMWRWELPTRSFCKTNHPAPPEISDIVFGAHIRVLLVFSVLITIANHYKIGQ